jgi:hypothetical protein
MDESKFKTIDAEPEEFRQIPDKPLANPRALRTALLVWTSGSLLAGFAGWQLLGGIWPAIFAIPPAMWAGAAAVGLWPRWFYGKPY